MLIGVRQQSQEACAFDCSSQLALVMRFGASDAGRDDFAVFRNEVFQQINLFVIDFLDFFSRKAFSASSALGQGKLLYTSVPE